MMDEINMGHLTEEQFHRIVYSIWDFEQALSALTFLKEDCDLKQRYSKVDLRRFRCYETQAIISFCRPFVACRFGVQLNTKMVGLVLSADERAFKEHLVYVRNKIVAHSDKEEMHYKGVTIKIAGDSANRAPFFQFEEGLHLNSEQRRMLESLLQKLIHALIKYTFKLCESDPDRFEIYRMPASMVESKQ